MSIYAMFVNTAVQINGRLPFEPDVVQSLQKLAEDLCEATPLVGSGYKEFFLFDELIAQNRIFNAMQNAHLVTAYRDACEAYLQKQGLRISWSRKTIEEVQDEVVS